MVRDYELMYIVRPDLDDEALRAATDSVEALVKGRDGEVLKTTMWGKRRLAYEVSHHRDGHYVIVELQLDTTKIGELERALEIHDTVFRHLLVRRDETADVEPGGTEEVARTLEVGPTAGSERASEAPDELPADEDETETETEDGTEADDDTETDDDEVPSADADEDEE